jgi:hypothetical protein
LIVNPGTPDFVGSSLIDDIKLAIERLFIRAVMRALEKELSNHRLAFPSGIPKGRVFGRHVPPAEQFNPLFNKNFFKDMPSSVALRCFLRSKNHAYAVFEGSWELNIKLSADRTQETVRHLHENTGAVSGIRFTTAGASVVKIDKNLKSLADNRMGLVPFDVDNEPYAAGIVLKPRIVEALF